MTNPTPSAEPEDDVQELIAWLNDTGEHYEPDKAAKAADALRRAALSASGLLERERVLREAILNARDWFLDYERQHLAKDTPAGNLKAAANRRRADEMSDALSNPLKAD